MHDTLPNYKRLIELRRNLNLLTKELTEKNL